MVDRPQRIRELVERMGTEEADGDARYIVLDGIALGRLSRATGAGWSCEWRSPDGWARLPGQVERDDAEYAEVWAMEAVASLLASEEQDRRRAQRG
ncbi:MAG: hypothetical protein M3296_01925 [Actinomycetota bacterium]|nr:hypothetical protein [Actinomycetota bacterium]